MKRMIRAMAILFLTVVLFCPVLVVAAGGEEGLETDMEDGEYSFRWIWRAAAVRQASHPLH